MMSVKDYFKNKNIFITGGSGFIGKALIEKILRTIPDIGNIYFLLRPKKGKTPEERLRTVLENEVFDSLRKINPEFLKKIILMEGDVQQLKLGISEENKKILIEHVDIIYHSAASIRFDDSLRSSILSNVRSTREIIKLALEAKHLKAFVHVSTAYSNSDKRVVEEKLYPSFGDWREAIRLAEECDINITDYLTEKYIHPLPNTYVYAKSLAEHVVDDMCRGKMPAIIVRPSIVSCAAFEPVPGWTDNLNGPMGLYYAGSLGLLRILYADGRVIQDWVPVDAVVNALILTTYEKLKNPLFHLQKKIYIANTVVSKFTLNTWYFKNHKTMEIEGRLTGEEAATFGIKKYIIHQSQNTTEYMRTGQIGIERHLKMKINREKNLTVYWRLWVLDIVSKILLGIFLIWIVRKTNVVGRIYQF